jgi:hypothetical protein
MLAQLTDKYQYFTEAKMSACERQDIANHSQSWEVGVGEYIRDYLSREDPSR